VDVRERGERAVRRQGGEHRGQNVALVVLGEGRPRKATDHHIGLAEATLREHPGQFGRVRRYDLDRRMPGGQLARESSVDLDGDVPAPAAEALLDGLVMAPVPGPSSTTGPARTRGGTTRR
jgi:hypothetical protein